MSYVELNTRHLLNEILVNLIGESSRERVLKGAVEGMMNVFRSPFAVMAFVNPEKKLVELLKLVSRLSDARGVNSIRDIDMTHAVNTGNYWDFIFSLLEDDSPMVLADLSMIVDPQVRKYAAEIKDSYKLVTYAVLPIHSNIRGILGGIVLGLRRKLSSEELTVLREFLSKLARILDFVDKLKEADFKDREAKLLLSLLQNVTTGDIERSLNQVARNLADLLNVDLVVISRFDKSSETLEAISAYGEGRDKVMGVRLVLDNCPNIANAFRTKKHFQVKENFTSECVPEKLRALVKLAIILKFPMFDSQGNPLGMLFVVKKRIQEFNNEEIGIVEQFAEMAALAIEKFQLSQEIISAKSYLDAVFNSQQDALIIVDANTRKIRDINKKGLGLFGIKREEIMSMDFYDFLSDFIPSDIIDEGFEHVLARQRPFRIQKVRGYGPNGTTVYYDISFSPIFLSGNITDILLSIRDITREVELEEKIKAINALGTELLNIRDPKNVAEAVCDIAESVIEFRKFILALIDEYRGEIVVYASRGENDDYKVGMVVPSDDRCIMNAATFGEPQNFPVSRSGYPELCVPIKAKENVLGVIKVVARTNREFDENDQRLLTALGSQAGMALQNAKLFVRLRKSERQYRTLFDNANDVILVIDRNGVITNANKLASRLTGYSRTDLVGKMLDEIFVPENADVSPLPLPDSRTGVRVEGYLITVFGQKVPVEWSASVGTTQKDIMYIGIARDLSEQKRAEKLLQSLNVAALTVMRHLSESEIFRTIGEELNKLGFKSAILAYNPRGGFFRIQYVSEEGSRMVYQKIKADDVPDLLDVIKSNRTKLLRNILPEIFPNKYMIAAPLGKNSKPFGLLVVASDYVSERDIPAINLFAHQVAIALENASLYQEIKAHAENLSRILKLSVSINAVPSMDETLRVLTGMTASVMGIPFAFVALYDETVNALRGVSPSFGVPENIIENTTIPLSNNTLAARVFRTGKVVFINDITRANVEYKEIALRIGIYRMLLTPLKVENKVIGVFYLGKKKQDPPFSENEARVFAILANHAATAIRNAQLFDELKVTLNKLEHTYDITLEALVSALDFREHETQFHSQRVAKYSERIAIELGIVDEELRYIYWGSLLHDVGKIGIPDAILLKPAKLNDKEWEIMKKHPLIGFKIVESIGFLGPARDIVLYHHERWDGRGYPFGLKGSEIPIGARIFALADTLDAITSDRPYRKALTFEYAIQEIARNRGKQFDPDITDVFLSIPIEEWKIIRTTLSQKNASKSKSKYVTPHGEEIPEIDHIIKW